MKGSYYQIITWLFCFLLRATTWNVWVVMEVYVSVLPWVHVCISLCVPLYWVKTWASHVSSVEACSVHGYVCMNMYIHTCIVLMGSHSAQILEKIRRPLYSNPFLPQNHAKPYQPLEKHQSLGSLDQENPVPSTAPAVSSEWSRQFRPIWQEEDKCP